MKEPGATTTTTTPPPPQCLDNNHEKEKVEVEEEEGVTPVSSASTPQAQRHSDADEARGDPRRGSGTATEKEGTRAVALGSVMIVPYSRSDAVNCNLEPLLTNVIAYLLTFPQLLPFFFVFLLFFSQTSLYSLCCTNYRLARRMLWGGGGGGVIMTQKCLVSYSTFRPDTRLHLLLPRFRDVRGVEEQ